MIISVTSSSKTNKPTKRSTPSLYKKKKIRVRGFVDRISNGMYCCCSCNKERNKGSFMKKVGRPKLITT